ncbi:MAG: purine-cytosine permease family protein [Actinomycetota bacterium]
MSTLTESDVAERPVVQPVPPGERHLSALDLGVLWGDLGVGLLVLVTGALLVPGLGFGMALVAIVAGSIIGVGMLTLMAVAGAQHGLPSMVLLRPVLGIRGSWLPTALNIVQLVGWTAVELWAMSYVADLISQEVFGFSARGVWLAIAALLCGGLALWGPVGVTRVWMERFGVWVVGAITIAVTIAVASSGELEEAIRSSGEGGWPTFGPALDLVIAMPISWFPLIADYTRYGRGPRAAFFGTFWGYLAANVWLYSLGALLVLTADATADPAGIALGILTLAGGSIAGVAFLVGLLAGETDEAFADIYSGAVSVRNILPRIPQRLLVVVITAIAAVLAALFTMALYESFLFLIGSVFVPLLGLVAADHFVRRRSRVEVRSLDGAGAYWFAGGVRWGAMIPWLAGFLVYHWINPSPLEWWLKLNQSVFGEPLSVSVPWLCASVPAFATAFLLGLLLPRDISSGDRHKRGDHHEDRSQVR